MAIKWLLLLLLLFFDIIVDIDIVYFIYIVSTSFTNEVYSSSV